MDSKTLTTLLIVIVCILLFPLAIGIIGGVFGLFGSILGGIFGLIGGLFGVIFGVIGAILGAIFGVFGWVFDEHHGGWPFNFFDGDLFTATLIVVIIVLLVRSKRKTAAGKRAATSTKHLEKFGSGRLSWIPSELWSPATRFPSTENTMAAPKRHLRILIGGAVLIVVALSGVLVALNGHSIRIAFHHWRMMENIGDRMNTPVGEDPTPAYLAAERHQTALISLGYFVEEKIALHNIRYPSPEAHSLWAELDKHSKIHLEVTMVTSDPPVVRIVDRPAAMPAWEEIVQRHDSQAVK